MTKIALKEAETKLAELVQIAAGGEEVLITNDEGVTVKMALAPQPEKKRRGLVGSAKGEIWIAEDFDDIPEGFEDYMP